MDLARGQSLRTRRWVGGKHLRCVLAGGGWRLFQGGGVDSIASALPKATPESPKVSSTFGIPLGNGLIREKLDRQPHQ